MRFLPIENVVYKTSLKEDEIIERLSENVEPEKIFGFGNNSAKSYRGKIIGQHFKIRRTTSHFMSKNYRYYFFPQINGVITNNSISVKMRPHTSIIVYLSVLLVVMGLVCTGKLLYPFLFDASIFIGGLVAIILYLCIMTIIVFNLESRKSKKDLIEIFQADVIEE